ncbi:MAG: Asp-tRNA(Asn)/Glu-tRNA(Gln) amidotransferase subunit GatC [Gammaproteobacteria bacterium]|nr:Asp-tRNA(Asn)/Glu-tRNA(Gln) amidotransferase subunit GatC [Gammaproteobacteria bacterium]
MTMTLKQFNQVALLAYLQPQDVAKHLEKCNTVISQIEHLQLIDTSNVSPLNHPTSVTQYLRPDDQIGTPEVQDLAKSAPVFEDNLFIVPQIIKE